MIAAARAAVDVKTVLSLTPTVYLIAAGGYGYQLETPVVAPRELVALRPRNAVRVSYGINVRRRRNHPKRCLVERERLVDMRHLVLVLGIASSCFGATWTGRLVPYAATKGAVKMFTQALSRELGSRGITVNNVQPGPIDTDLNPASGDWAVPQKAATALDRYGRVEEIAAMVAFVAGPESSYITGTNLTVDGGMNA